MFKRGKATLDLTDLISPFPQVYKALSFCKIPITVATAERSFQKLQLIKTYLRSTMVQKRLLAVSILSNESEEARPIDKRRLIDTNFIFFPI